MIAVTFMFMGLVLTVSEQSNYRKIKPLIPVLSMFAGAMILAIARVSYWISFPAILVSSLLIVQFSNGESDLLTEEESIGDSS